MDTTELKFNRNNFILLHQCRLFTAKEVADLIRKHRGDAQHEKEEILNDIAQYTQKHHLFKGSVACVSLHPLNKFLEKLRSEA